MVFTRFLITHLLVLLALQSLSVYAVHHHQDRRLLERGPIKVTQENDVSLKKGIGCGSNEERNIGGRKMASISSSDTQKLNVEQDKKASKERAQDFLNHQVIHHFYTKRIQKAIQGQENPLDKMTINPSQNALKQFYRSISSPLSSNANNIFPHDDGNNDRRKLLEEANTIFIEDYSHVRRRKPPSPTRN